MSTELALIMNYKKKKMLKNPCSLPLLAICSVWASKVSLSSWRSDWLSSRWSGWPPSWWSWWLSSASWCSRTPGCWLSSWPLLWCDFVTLQCSLPIVPSAKSPNCAITILYVFNTILPMMVETSESARKYKCYMLIQAFSDQQKITVLSFLQMSLIYVRFSLLLYVPNFVCSVYGKKSI